MLRRVFERALDAMVIVDDDGQHVDANPAAVALFGVAREVLLASTQMELLGPQSELYSAWRSLLHNGRAEGTLLLARHARHRLVDFRATAHVVPSRHFWTFRDVTERREVEEQIRQTVKMESVGLLAAGIAHDFNNMLSGIQGFATFVQEDLPEGSPLHDDIEQILRATQRAAALTRPLLAFGRKQVLRPSVVLVDDVVADIGKMLRRLVREDIAVQIVAGAPGARVHIDSVQLQEVLVNLAVNARDAMEPGGTLRIATRETIDRGEDAHGASFVRGPAVTLIVQDDGVGMDEPTMRRAFEPFFTTKKNGQGTGLGLSTAYGFVRQSGGHITVSSELGRGTTFRITLPRWTGPDETRVLRPTTPATLHGTETILVVEDDRVVRELVVRALHRHGYEVIEAPTSGDAMLAFEQHGARIDLLLTDVVMPRMSGTELAKRLLAARPDLRVVFISGYGEDDLAGRGHMELIHKPFAPADLLAFVRRALRPLLGQ